MSYSFTETQNQPLHHDTPKEKKLEEQTRLRKKIYLSYVTTHACPRDEKNDIKV